jgi:N-acetylglucosamine malate deacetylase 1
MKVLVIAPHPDDEVLGCGGTIKKHSNGGDEVYLCIATKAYVPDWTQEFIDNRKKEIALAGEILGVKETLFLDFPTVKLDTIAQKQINDLIAEIIDKVSPEIIYLPFDGDINRDHKIIFNASMLALRSRFGSLVKKILCYEVISETEWGDKPFVPNLYIDVTDVIEDKLRAMDCYKSEVRDYPHPRSLESIRVLAQKRGVEARLKMAEAFVIKRELEK